MTDPPLDLVAPACKESLTVMCVNERLHASRRLPARAVLELLKPVTWFPPMWAFACGAVGAGMTWSEFLGRGWLGLLLTGPLVCGASQAVNDWFDREVDAHNEPQRPIPSGRLPGRTGLAIAIGWTALSALAGLLLGPWGFAATLVALAFAWGYSAPPFRFKQNGWVGNLSVGVTYEGLAWTTGAVLALGGARPDGATLLVALLYSLGAHGIMTLNDFKAIAGDRRHGVASLPVLLGPDRAARVACLTMLAPQLVVLALLAAWGRWEGAVVGALVAAQLPLMRRLLAAPVPRARWYSGAGVPLFVLGMMATAHALRALAGAVT